MTNCRGHLRILNKQRLLKWGLFVFFLCIAPLLQAQVTPLFKFDRKRQKKTAIPFKLVNNLVIIPMFVNGSDTLNFILDTGVNATLVTSLQGVDSLMLTDTRRIELAGLGDGEPISAIRSRNNVVELQGLSGYGQIIYLLEEDIFHLSLFMGMPVHGLLGHALFTNFVVEIDYQRQLVVFHDPQRYRKRGRFKKIPIDVVRGKPYVNMTVRTKTGEEKTLRLLIDTGASHALSLYGEDSTKQLPVPQKSFRSFLGKGLSGDVYGEIGRLESAKLGKYELEEPIASFPDLEAVERALSLSNRDGSVGADLLRRFRVVFDYPRGVMYLKRSGYFKQPFTYNMSGIELSTPFPGMPYYQVSAIREGSPAAEAGVQKDDQLIEVNATSVTRYSLSELTKLFQERPGKYINVLIERNGVLIKYRFQLSDDL